MSINVFRGRLVSDSVLEDDDDEERRREKKTGGGSYWFKQLMKAEENDPDRSVYAHTHPSNSLHSPQDHIATCSRYYVTFFESSDPTDVLSNVLTAKFINKRLTFRSVDLHQSLVMLSRYRYDKNNF